MCLLEKQDCYDLMYKDNRMNSKEPKIFRSTKNDQDLSNLKKYELWLNLQLSMRKRSVHNSYLWFIQININI